MLKFDVININGEKVGSVDLKKSIFAKEYNEALIHQVVVAHLANRRQGTKSTLTRAEVRGGGAKPWRQKGTGRARQGSIRSPQWVGGGVVFAPKPRDYGKKVNKKMKEAALLSALSKKAADSKMLIVDKIELAEGKTKNLVQVLNNLQAEKSSLIVLADDNVNVLRASQNLQKIEVLNVDLLNLYSLVKYDKFIITLDAIKSLMEAHENE